MAIDATLVGGGCTSDPPFPREEQFSGPHSTLPAMRAYLTREFDALTTKSSHAVHDPRHVPATGAKEAKEAKEPKRAKEPKGPAVLSRVARAGPAARADPARTRQTRTGKRPTTEKDPSWCGRSCKAAHT